MYRCTISQDLEIFYSIIRRSQRFDIGVTGERGKSKMKSWQLSVSCDVSSLLSWRLLISRKGQPFSTGGAIALGFSMLPVNA